MLKIGFIGAGTVGSALALRLREKGYPVVAVSSRTFTSAEKLAASIPGCRAAPPNVRLSLPRTAIRGSRDGTEGLLSRHQLTEVKGIAY